MYEWLMVGVGLLLTVGTGLFVASEFALVNLDRADLESRRDKGEKRLNPTINALKITSTHLSSAQLGITLTTLLTGYTFEPAISSMLRSPLTALGLPEDYDYDEMGWEYNPENILFENTSVQPRYYHEEAMESVVLAIAEGEPQKLEHNDIQWITPSEIQNYEFCPADEEILAKICEVYK